MKIKNSKKFLPVIAAALFFIFIFPVIVLQGCAPADSGAQKKDNVSDNTGSNGTSNTTGDDSNAGVIYDNAPQDFSVQLTFSTGSLPPPHYYSYSISCGPGQKGVFTYQDQKNFSQDSGPLVIDFDITVESMDGLYVFLQENNFFRSKWDKAEPVIGGSYTVIKINANGKTYNIPPDSELKPEDAKMIGNAAQYINSLVPESIWVQIQKLQADQK